MELPKLILVPILTGIAAQGMKLLLELLRSGNFHLRQLNVYGGMPSSHTALVVSITTVIGIEEGIFSAAFAIAVVFAIITVRDAIGFRMYLGEHAQILNKLIAELPSSEKPKFPKHIIEHIGHTPLQALAGGLLGFFVTLILWVVLP